MHTYYKEIKIEEHMLYPSEIAQIAGLYSLSDKPATLLVSAILQEHIKTLDNYEQYYYVTKNNKNKVYSMEVYKPAMLNFFKSLIEEYGDSLPDKIQRNINNKNYSFKFNIEE